MILTHSLHRLWPLPLTKREGVMRIDGVYNAGGEP